MDSLAETALRPGYRPTLGLVLTGGGARSAYQVGVLLALAELWPRSRNPFQIIVGTSAGGVAAGVLAAEAHQWRRAVAGLERVWANFRSSQVFHVDSRHMLRAGAHWVLALMSGGLVLAPPRSMLDNTPLRELLGTHVDCAGIRRSIERGHLRAFALCSTSYGTGHSVAFFDGVDSIPDWARVQRVGCRTELGVDHVMASAAIPLLFPPIRIGEEYFGDGAMRQLHPLSPAIHLGADRLLIIGVRARRAAGVTVNRHQSVMMLAPSVDPREIAGRHVREMPRGLRALLRVIGGRDTSSYQLASYLMFEAGYTRALIELGYRDAMEARGGITAFMSGEKLPTVMTAAGVAQAT